MRDVRRIVQIRSKGRFELAGAMAVDDAKIRRTFESSPIQRRYDLIQRFIGCPPPDVDDRLCLCMVRPFGNTRLRTW